MAARMIRVRNKTTGQETQVSERAFGYFAGDFERLDATSQTSAPAGGASEVLPQSVHTVTDDPTNPKTARRTPAATTEKEQ